MLEHTKTPRIEFLRVICPADRLEQVVHYLRDNGCSVSEDDELLPAEAVLDLKPSTALRGARGKEEMTQVELSRRTGISVRRIRDMENDRRPIDEPTARILGEALNIGYRVFLHEEAATADETVAHDAIDWS